MAINVERVAYGSMSGREALGRAGGLEALLLVLPYDKPFSVSAFGNWFKDRCREAGLPHCSAHGLRKATARRLAEAGASPHEIMAITGHQTPQQVEAYTKAANRSKMTDSGFARLKK